MHATGPHRFVIDRFDSFDQLYDALQTRTVPRSAPGGVVRVHPGRFSERGITEVIEARRRVGEFGLTLTLTPAVGIECVELRRAVREAEIAR
ncbi:MAG TPA: hypothetical protein VFK13_01445 [Gemmatimonadaceae bacterium]|nr:hypothetical protein [Gemmatimonadaceae bacterium]